MGKITLRTYQQEAINAVLHEPLGSKVILALAVGLGKSFTAAQIATQLEDKLGRPVRTLWLSRQRELTFQPTKYFDKDTIGIEMGNLKTSGDEKNVFSTIQTLHRRLDKFDQHEFDLVVADECFTGDVEILTDEGFIRFDELENQKVAQIHDNFKLEYVQPIRKIQYHYEGEMVRSYLNIISTSETVELDMTPNHNQVYYDTRTKTLESVAIKNYHHGNNAESYRRIVNYLNKNNDSDRKLTEKERLFIALQADGSLSYVGNESNIYNVSFAKERKKERFVKLCKNANVDIRVGIERSFENNNRQPLQYYYVNLKENAKLFENVFDYDFTYTRANEFIDELVHWDGHKRKDRKNSIEYSSISKENVEFVCYVGFIAGYNTSMRVHNRGSNRNLIYTAYLSKTDKVEFRTGVKFNVDRVDYSGEVYCVEVPTHRIVIRKGGYTIVTGNCHEAKGKQYEDVLNYFKPAYTVGLTGTPFRLDGKKLTDGLFDKIVYEKNIKWGIENGYLSDVDAVRAYVGYDLSNVRTSGGDYNITDLNEAVIGTEDAIADAYEKYGKGKPTLIFATGVDHAFAIASKIEGAEVIVGDTPQEERDRIFNGFENEEIPVIVSVQVMTQGVDLPISEVGIFAKPTKSVGRYQQQVGRILRKHPNKDRALIVDCVGTSSLGLCTAPNLIGINVDKIPERKQEELEGDLMEMPELAELLSDTPMSWIKNEKIVDLWAKENDYDTGKVNFFQLPDGKMVVSLPERAKITIPPPDMLGMVDATGITGLAPDFHGWGLERYGNKWEYQRALNAVKAYLERNYSDSAALWDLTKVKQWGRKPATEAQMKLINRKLKGEELPDEINRFEASQIINRIKNGYKPSKRRKS